MVHFLVPADFQVWVVDLLELMVFLRLMDFLGLADCQVLVDFADFQIWINFLT